jgi:hypothetical protein
MASASTESNKSKEKKPNDCIYGFALIDNKDNFLTDLRNDLESLGFIFAPSSDNEIIEISKSTDSKWLEKVRAPIESNHKYQDTKNYRIVLFNLRYGSDLCYFELNGGISMELNAFEKHFYLMTLNKNSFEKKKKNYIEDKSLNNNNYNFTFDEFKHFIREAYKNDDLIPRVLSKNNLKQDLATNNPGISDGLLNSIVESFPNVFLQ